MADTSHELSAIFCLCCKYYKIHLHIIESVVVGWLGMLKFMAIFADG